MLGVRVPPRLPRHVRQVERLLSAKELYTGSILVRVSTLVKPKMKTILAVLATIGLVGCGEYPDPNIGNLAGSERTRIDEENQKSLNTPQKMGNTRDGGELWCVILEPYRGSGQFFTYITYPKPKNTPVPTYYKQTNVIVDGKPTFTQETLPGPQK